MDFNKIKPHKSAKDPSGEFGCVIKQVSEPVRQILEILEKNEGSYLIVKPGGYAMKKTKFTGTRGILCLKNGPAVPLNNLYTDFIIEYCERIEALGEGKYKYQLHPDAMKYIRQMEQTQ